jgi:ubiquinone/menaquinone biosynthesis C-methylase UbiE
VALFPRPADFAAIVSSHGFTGVRAVPLTLGIVYLYIATRA